jgi:hypothetical protein
MENFIKEMERKGFHVWAAIKSNDRSMVCLVNEACNYSLYYASKSTERYLNKLGYKFTENERAIKAVKRACKMA